MQHDPAENQPRRFASRQRRGGLHALFPAEQHLPQQPAKFFHRRLRIELMQPLNGRHPLLDGFLVVLRKIPDRDLVPPGDRPAVHLKSLFRVIHVTRSRAQQRPQQRGLARAVAPHQRHLLAARQRRRKALDHLQVVVGFRQALEFQGMLARRPLHVEPDIRPLNIRPGQLGGLQPLHFLLAGRHLAGSGAGRKARDEFVQLRDLFVALRIVRFDPGPHLRLRHHHVVVPAGVGDDRLVVDIGDMRANVVQKVPVVRNHDQRSFVIPHVILQPVDRIQIQVVGGFVQQQGRRMAEQRLRQQHANLLPALQLAHGALMQRFVYAQPVQQDGRIAIRRIPVLFADDAFQFSQAHAVGIGQFIVRLVVKLFPFLQRFP